MAFPALHDRPIAVRPSPLRRAAVSAARRLRAWLAPDCIVCGLLPGDPVCAACRADYFPVQSRCPGCALLLSAVSASPPGTRCGACVRAPRRFDAAVVLADYAPPLDAMVAALKFQGRLDLGLAFGRLLAQRLDAASAASRYDAVVALPLAPQRLRSRGYNQALEIARALAQECGLPLAAGMLLRQGRRPPQQALGRRQRRSNVRGVFRATARAAGLRLLLVDDVLTTGATLEAAARALKRVGARHVTALAVARTP